MSHKLLSFLKIIIIPVVYAIILRVVFGLDNLNELFSVMSVTFLLCLPTIVGILCTYLSPLEAVDDFAYKFFLPWVPIGIFFFATILLNLEGWACWLMVLPIFLIAASVGGFMGAWLKKRKHNRLNISLLVLLPLFIAPIENLVDKIPATYRAYTFIDITSTKEKIWNNVTRVETISENEDSGDLTSFLGFPRPVRAELDFNGIGAYRKAIFTNGLVFHETVYEYAPFKKMRFTIKANPHEIPSTTMDEHILIGGEYFDVINGTYELESLGANSYRLHLYSHFQMNTTFNFYAGFWGNLIMKDIQNNILRVIKKRSEMK